MAIIVGDKVTGNYGEDYFVSKAQEYLDDSYVIYRNRQLYGKEFDVCILMPNKGILVVELKGWREETILRVENDNIIIQTEEGEVSASPQKQARGYRFSIQRYIKNSLGLNPLVFQMVCLKSQKNTIILAWNCNPDARKNLLWSRNRCDQAIPEFASLKRHWQAAAKHSCGEDRGSESGANRSFQEVSEKHL